MEIKLKEKCELWTWANNKQFDLAKPTNLLTISNNSPLICKFELVNNLSNEMNEMRMIKYVVINQ